MMKRLRSAVITNVIGLCFLFLSLYGFRFIHDYFNLSSKVKIYDRVQVDRVELKGRLQTLSDESLQKMLKAGKEIKEWSNCLKKTHSNIVKEIDKQKEVFWKINFNCIGGTFDQESYSQCYYHSHRNNGEHGHFHLFLRGGGIPSEMTPVLYDKRNKTLNAMDTYAHLVAISMDHNGNPIGLFTTNKWVTGEDWYTGEDVAQMVNYFHIGTAEPSWIINQWLNAVVIFFSPQIKELLIQRDQKLPKKEETDVFIKALKESSVEILTQEDVSFETQYAVIEEILKERSL